MPTKASSLVIGISGGIDSSVSSTLSALTGLKTIAISMPIKQKSVQHDLSLKHQEWLKKNFISFKKEIIFLSIIDITITVTFIFLYLLLNYFSGYIISIYMIIKFIIYKLFAKL